MIYILFENEFCNRSCFSETACKNISVYPTEEEEAEGSYNIDASHTIKVPPFRELLSSSILKDPSPSSVVKLEVNQKAKNKRERQELYGEYKTHKHYLLIRCVLYLSN